MSKMNKDVRSINLSTGRTQAIVCEVDAIYIKKKEEEKRKGKNLILEPNNPNDIKIEMEIL